MFSKKTYGSVSDMVRDVADDPAFADDFDKHVAERQLVSRLFALRCAKGLSQKDVAVKMGCTQGRISKLEASRDEDLKLGDIRAYAQALGLTTVLGLEGGPTAAARVKFHHACVRKEVHALAKLAVTNDSVAEAIAKFFDAAAFNFLTTLEEATKQLPPEVRQHGVSVVVISPDEPTKIAGDMVVGRPVSVPRSKRPRKATPA